MPEIVKMEINNDLNSLFKQKADVVSDLYKKVCLIREALEEKLSSSDSSRNISQMRLGIEQKNRKYYTNIAEGLKPYIQVVLQENKVWNISDEDNITFEVPTVLINNSIFDEMLMKAQQRALGETTLEEELIKKGKDEKEIQEHKDRVTEEIYGGQQDLKFAKNEAKNASMSSNNVAGLDNNFK